MDPVPGLTTHPRTPRIIFARRAETIPPVEFLQHRFTNGSSRWYDSRTCVGPSANLRDLDGNGLYTGARARSTAGPFLNSRGSFATFETLGSQLMANRNIERAVRIALLAAGAVSVGAYSSGTVAQTAGARNRTDRRHRFAHRASRSGGDEPDGGDRQRADRAAGHAEHREHPERDAAGRGHHDLRIQQPGRRRGDRQPARSRFAAHPRAGRRPTLCVVRREPGRRPEHDPGLPHRTHRRRDGRPLGRLRFGRHRRRRELRHEGSLPGRRVQHRRQRSPAAAMARPTAAT